jgi:hypothetical protein
MPNLTAEQAIQINQTIDRYHDPRYWSIFGILSLIFLLEVFFPTKKVFKNKLDSFFSHFKFSILLFTSLILISQGIFGGCVIQIPQNWLAQKYLNLPYWYPYGLVYRESFDSSFWPVLRTIYILITILYFYWLYHYYRKRLHHPRNNSKTRV